MNMSAFLFYSTYLFPHSFSFHFAAAEKKKNVLCAFASTAAGRAEVTVIIERRQEQIKEEEK